MANRRTPRHSTCNSSLCRDSPRCNRDCREKAMATPTINKKKGKTRSVGVQPFHSECFNGQYEDGPSPGSLTKIIAAIVTPRNTSSDISLPGSLWPAELLVLSAPIGLSWDVAIAAQF